jgi:AraC-like DNA-binding protein
MKAGFDELRERVRALATREGRTDTAFGDLHVFRADAPKGPTRVETRGVVVAAIADRQKRVEVADGRTLSYGVGSYLFVTREARYVSTIPEASARRPYLSLGLVLPVEQVAEAVFALDEAGEDGGAEDVDAWVGRLDDALLDGFLRLLRSVGDPVELRLVSPLIVRELIVRLLRSEHAAPLRRAALTDDGRIRRAIRFITEHAEEPLTVDALARRVAMSPSHFAHRFRAVARVSPMRYVKQVRLDRARLLMLREGIGASEAANEVGYASPSHFTRDFKAVFGAPPAAYAQRLRGVDGQPR